MERKDFWRQELFTAVPDGTDATCGFLRSMEQGLHKWQVANFTATMTGDAIASKKKVFPPDTVWCCFMGKQTGSLNAPSWGFTVRRNVMTMRVCAMMAMVMLVGSAACAMDMVSVGSGSESASVYVEFGDTYQVTFDVAFDDPCDTMTGYDLMTLIEGAGIGLELDVVVYSSGPLINGITYDGHSDIGWQGGANWWHYWIVEPVTQEWISPAYGAADRLIDDGDMDGWVYGRDSVVPEPASLALLGIGAMILRRRGKRS